MAQSGYKLPTSLNSIKNMVMKHGETVKLSIINKLQKLKNDGVKVSNLLAVLEERLLAFELSLKDDVICTTTDGASVIVAFGRDASIFHQQCLAYGIQLAILDVLYKNKDNCQTRNKKVFRKSPTINDLLQKYVKEEMIGETNLILDCRTRWNSLADMLERFVKLKVPIQKAMIDLKINQELSESEYRRLADLSRVFEILKATVEELCKRTASLITADTALKFMFTKLDAMQHELVARELVTSL
ncbi:hypothetical protein HF086_014750, partial [Spodoptera exigua]